jgi:hypothetical protein
MCNLRSNISPSLSRMPLINLTNLDASVFIISVFKYYEDKKINDESSEVATKCPPRKVKSEMSI